MNPASKKPSDRDTKDGTIGFSPQLDGHAKADQANTSSFDAGSSNPTIPDNSTSRQNEQTGQEEGGRKRQPSTSSVTRADKE